MPQLFDIRKLVKERPRSPAEVLAKAVVALSALDTLGRERGEREAASVHKYLGYLKFWLFGDEAGHEPTKESVVALAREVVRTEFASLLVHVLPVLDFETRKDAAQVFGAIVRIRDEDGTCPGAAYVRAHPDILATLFAGYGSV
jgi:calcium binding protein 39